MKNSVEESSTRYALKIAPDEQGSEFSHVVEARVAEARVAEANLAEANVAQENIMEAGASWHESADSATSRPIVSPPSVARFPAFSHRNFRLFWFGNLVSLVGTWAQQTAQGWLMRQMTPDPATISFVAACGSIPILLLTLYTGAFADRADKRRTLMWTNAISLGLALLFGALVALKIVQIWQIALLAFAVGVVNAFDIPVRQSFNVEMVGRDDLPNAIALNSSAFNAARVLGPASGGWLLHQLGIAGCFFVNALSFVALIFGLSKMRLETNRNAISSTRFESETVATTRDRRESNGDLWDGFRFVRNHRVLCPVVILVAFVSIFAMSFSSLLPVFAKDIFRTDARGFSLLMTCNGLGALSSAVALSVLGGMRHRGKRLLLGALLFCLSIVAFASAPTLIWGCIALIFAGWFLLTFLMTANTLVQTLAPDELRGRVFSLYSLALIGTSPLGASVIGLSARFLGTRHAVALSASFAAAFCVILFLSCRRLWKEA